ncbi:T-cell-interacting, activating receptor on myeloid cells protein 1 [Myotis brandtii]|nr:T-cell-interacting, activating receptor on myeloid cells protein 1 [Myotis brandtii]
MALVLVLQLLALSYPTTSPPKSPKPSLAAQPAAVVTPGTNVTLTCRAPQPAWRFVLYKAGEVSPVQHHYPDESLALARFFLEAVTEAQGGSYRCEYHNPRGRSHPSDALELMVTGSLPRPSIRARPSWVVPANSTVTLQCSIPIREVIFRDIKFAFRKNNVSLESLPSSDSPEGLAEFHLSDIKLGDAGKYTCDYRTGSPTRRSLLSDVLLLLVTGELLKPSLHARPGCKVTAGENVILQCQLPKNVIEPHMFALLKKGTSTPIKLQGPVKTETDFSLPSVTVNDTGAYSCVYYVESAPFYASEPSDELTISVTGTTEIILIVIVPLLFLLTAFLICKYTCCDASPATQSCSPALDEGSQVSRAEEPQGVTYAELNTRALSKGPSSQVPQSPETCVYSALKM